MEGEGSNGDIVSMLDVPRILSKLQDSATTPSFLHQSHYPTTPLTSRQHCHGTESVIVCEKGGVGCKKIDPVGEPWSGE